MAKRSKSPRKPQETAPKEETQNTAVVPRDPDDSVDSGTLADPADPGDSPQLSDFDLYLFAEGTHQRLWECLGARPMTHEGVAGYNFAVWAPNATSVSVIGDFCQWNAEAFVMQRRGESGVFECFVADVEAGELYKYSITGADGSVRTKADPFASWAERAPGTASRTFHSEYRWQDGDWMTAASTRDVRRRPMSIYEVHLGSWGGGCDEPSSYQELAESLVSHVKELGFDYVELMPVAEYPYDGSWGYQITGYYAPTARFGDPDGFRYFVDHCHQNGIGVIVDWVPAHFVKDAHGLGRFDGSALYEHEDPRRGEHPDWGTYIFNYGRFEVRNFLVANALYWLEEFHVDGLRVDAVASMLYLDYSRKEGEWIPNDQGGRENLEAVALLQEVNRLVRQNYPGRFTIAEESTSWTGVTADEQSGGLGFTFKWNMGWMHDTLAYFKTDPLFRPGCHDQLTFAMVYEHSEAFINPLSHDEVVHGKGSLWNKMAGDPWRKMAHLRTLLAYQFTRPGKQLLFMGSELASRREWNHQTGLDWYLRGDPERGAFFDFVKALAKLYRQHSCLWQSDPDPQGFQWIACHDKERSVFVYGRFLANQPVVELSPEAETSLVQTGAEVGEHLLIALNLTPMPREDYRVGVPAAGNYRCLLDSDAKDFGGSGYKNPPLLETEATACDGYRQSVQLTLPPLAALVLAPESAKRTAPKKPAKPASKKPTRTKAANKKLSTKKPAAKKR